MAVVGALPTPVESTAIVEISSAAVAFADDRPGVSGALSSASPVIAVACPTGSGATDATAIEAPGGVPNAAGDPALVKPDPKQLESRRQKAEELASQFNTRHETDHQYVSRREFRRVIRLWLCHASKTRKKTRPEGADFVLSDTFGVTDAVHSICLTQYTTKYPEFAKALNSYICGQMRDQKFYFSGFTFNRFLLSGTVTLAISVLPLLSPAGITEGANYSTGSTTTANLHLISCVRRMHMSWTSRTR